MPGRRHERGLVVRWLLMSESMTPHQSGRAVGRLARSLALGIGIWSLSGLLAGCLQAPVKPAHVPRGDYPPVTNYIRALTLKEMSDHEVVGLSIALVDDQQVIWAEGFGYADKARKIPAGPETLYRVGSVTKLFTASAVMQLADQGQLDIDCPLQRYLPEFAIKTRDPGADPITLRNLLTHHSGLPRDYFKGMWGARPKPFASVVQSLHDEYAVYPANLLFSYSNVGFTLLGTVVETVSGVPYAEYLDQALLQPMGMRQSSISHGPPPMTKAYRNGREVDEPLLSDLPAGGLNSSVADLSRFLSMVFAQGQSHGRQVLNPETVRAMLRPQNTDQPLDVHFHVGLGWMLSVLSAHTIEGAGTVAHHGGATIFHRAQLIALPEHKLGVVVLANSDSAGQVVGRIAAEALQLALAVKTGIHQPPPPTVSASETPLAPALAQGYAGTYTTLAGLVTIEADGGQLTARIMGKSFRLFPRTDGQLGVTYLLFGLIPIQVDALEGLGFSRRSVAGREVLIGTLGGQDMLVGEKMGAMDLTPAWQRRRGAYELINRDHDYDMIGSITADEEHGVAFVDIRMKDTLGVALRRAIRPLSDTEALVLHTLDGMGDTLRVVTAPDGSEVLESLGYRFRRTK